MSWRNWFSRLWEQKLDAELRFHIDQQVENYVQRGDTPEEARRKALLDFGGLEQVKEECRDSRKFSYLDTLLRNARYGLRLMTKNPKFALVRAN